MKRTRPNDPAAPCPEGAQGFKGLTKREHFAALALQGMLAAEGCQGADQMAGTAVAFADALIETLNTEN